LLSLKDVIIPAAPAHANAVSHVFTRNALGISLPVSPTMTLCNAARSLTPALRRLAYRQARTVSHRQFSASAHSPPKSSDMPWIVRLRHPFSLLSCPQLVVRAHRSGPRSSSSRQSVFQHVYVSRPQCICKLSSRSDIYSRLLRAPNHIMSTTLLVMASLVLPRRTPRQRLHSHQQSRPRYAIFATCSGCLDDPSN
jgi:hypothetical protein